MQIFQSTTQSTIIWRLLVGLLLGGLSLGYGRGCLRLRLILPQTMTRMRLAVFGISMLALTLSLIAPLERSSHYLLAARSLQKILLCMIAAPLFWLACPFHCIVWGAPTRLRQKITKFLRRRSPSGQLLRSITRPSFTWLFFVSTFLIWHDPIFVNYVMPHPWWHRAALCLLFGAALLFWWHIVETGPRIHGRFPDWVRFACLIGVEIPNIVSGITIAFQTKPLYSYYATMNAAFNHPLQLTMIDDQTISGGMIWVFGSLVYFSSAVMVLNKIFRENNGNSPLPLPNWDADERMIAPGLEHRVIENRWRQKELSAPLVDRTSTRSTKN